MTHPYHTQSSTIKTLWSLAQLAILAEPLWRCDAQFGPQILFTPAANTHHFSLPGPLAWPPRSILPPVALFVKAGIMSSNNDNAMARFLFAILQQKCLKDVSALGIYKVGS